MTDRKRGIARGSDPPEPSEPQGSVAVAAIRSVQALLDAHARLHPLPPPAAEADVDDEEITLVK